MTKGNPTTQKSIFLGEKATNIIAKIYLLQKCSFPTVIEKINITM
tara:strand:+ start:203 stop:337 length:135 start_codon:yes stop_codon:yes gene_type:complete